MNNETTIHYDCRTDESTALLHPPQTPEINEISGKRLDDMVRAAALSQK